MLFHVKHVSVYLLFDFFLTLLGSFAPFGVSLANSLAILGLLANKNLRCALDLKGMIYNRVAFVLRFLPFFFGVCGAPCGMIISSVLCLLSEFKIFHSIFIF